MKFRTEVFPEIYNLKISHRDSIMAIGSCFTENIGQKIKRSFFDIDINPFGVLYNPASIRESLNTLINKRKFKQNDLRYHNEQWFSYAHHSSFSAIEADDCLENINQRIDIAAEKLRNIKMLLITFGTSWVYKLVENKQIVSNCHKMPASDFERFILNTDTIVTDFQDLIGDLKKINPKLHIVFTISPVRHWKDGANGNQISKAILLLAVNKLCETENVHYFPSYELVLDDLRDYRYFNDDMLHPNNKAVEYIWEKFSDSFFDEDTQNLNIRLEKLYLASQHRPFNPESVAHKKFISSQLSKIKSIKNEYPYLDMLR